VFTTIKVDIVRMYMKEKIMLKDMDIYGHLKYQGFHMFDCHFVELNWKLNNKLLNFYHMLKSLEKCS